MGRRTSGARVGLEKIGLVAADAATLRTTQTNLGITISPNGTGTTSITSATSITGNTSVTGNITATGTIAATSGISGNISVSGNVTITAQNQLRLSEASVNGTNFIALRAATNMAADYTLTWPAAVTGTTGFVLSSDTSGNLSWVSAAGTIAVADPGAVATIHYPLFGTNGGAVPTTLSPNARSNLQFVPSTGELFATIGRYPDIIGNTAVSGTLTIRGTSSGTKFTGAGGSVRMTDNVASSSTTTGTLVVTGGVGVSGDHYIGGLVRHTNTTGSSSSATGALVVSGGTGIGGNLFVGGTINATGSLNATGGTSGIIGYTLQSAGATLADIDRYYVVNNSGAITLTLPATNTNGRTIVIADGNNFQTNVVTLGRNGRNIAGVAEDLILNVRNSRVELVYVSGDWKTFVF